MTNEQVGIYIRLLCAQHQHKGIIDKVSFNFIVGDHQIIRRKFKENDEGFFNVRLKEETLKRNKYTESRKNGAYALHMHKSCKKDVVHTENVNENENKNNKELINNKGRATIDEVKDYCVERKNKINAEQFVDYYTANGWTQGRGKPIKDWKAAVRTWERNGFSNENKPNYPKRPEALIKMDQWEKELIENERK